MKTENSLSLQEKKYFERLKECLPKNVLDKTWIPDKEVPKSCAEVNTTLKTLCFNNLGRKYRLKIDAGTKHALTLKLLASELFKGRKASYAASVSVPFTSSRIEEMVAYDGAMAALKKVKTPEEHDTPVYSTVLHKFDRSSYKHKRDDIVIVSNTHVRVFSFPKPKEKFALSLTDLVRISVGNKSDGVIVISTPGTDKGDKGDFIFDTPHVIEFASYIIHTLAVKPGPPSPGGEQFHGIRPGVGEKLTIAEELEPTLKNGKVGKVVFGVGEPEYTVVKLASGKALKVTAPQLGDPKAFMRQVRSSLRLKAPSGSN